MPTLIEIGDRLRDLDALLDESKGELTPELELWLVEARALECEKIDGYAAMIKQYQAVASACEAQANELAFKAAAATQRAKWLMDRMREHLEGQGRDEAVGLIWRFAFQKNGGAPPVEVLVPVEDLPRRFQRVSVTPDKAALAAGIEQGDDEALMVARFGERGRTLRLR